MLSLLTVLCGLFTHYHHDIGVLIEVELGWSGSLEMKFHVVNKLVAIWSITVDTAKLFVGQLKDSPVYNSLRFIF